MYSLGLTTFPLWPTWSVTGTSAFEGRTKSSY
jgi:hypothetical protein